MMSITWVNSLPDSEVTSDVSVATLAPIWSNFSKTEKSKGDEVIVASHEAPLACPTTVRFTKGTVSNIYQNSGIDPNFRAQTNRGISLVVGVKNGLIGTDSDTGEQVVLPLSCHFVVKVPLHSQINGQTIVRMLQSLIGSLDDTALSGDTRAARIATRIDSMLRGGLTPPTLV